MKSKKKSPGKACKSTHEGRNAMPLFWQLDKQRTVIGKEKQNCWHNFSLQDIKAFDFDLLKQKLNFSPAYLSLRSALLELSLRLFSRFLSRSLFRCSSLIRLLFSRHLSLSFSSSLPLCSSSFLFFLSFLFTTIRPLFSSLVLRFLPLLFTTIQPVLSCSVLLFLPLFVSHVSPVFQCSQSLSFTLYFTCSSPAFSFSFSLFLFFRCFSTYSYSLWIVKLIYRKISVYFSKRLKKQNFGKVNFPPKNGSSFPAEKMGVAAQVECGISQWLT